MKSFRGPARPAAANALALPIGRDVERIDFASDPQRAVARRAAIAEADHVLDDQELRLLGRTADMLGFDLKGSPSQ